MRSSALLQLAFGLFSIANVAASPCKPRSTVSDATDITITTASADTSVYSTEYSVTSAMVETTATSDTTVLTTVESATAESTTTEAITTDGTTTTAAPTAETTSNAPMPTFTMIASRAGAVQGQGLQSFDMEGSLTAFDVRYPGWSAHTYTIDSQGRLVNDQGWFLCGKYFATNFELNRPAIVSTCSAETPSQSVFLTCELSADLEVKCSIPAVSCVANANFFLPPTCVAAAGTWGIFSLGQTGPGNSLHIGGSEGSANYPLLSMKIQKV